MTKLSTNPSWNAASSKTSIIRYNAYKGKIISNGCLVFHPIPTKTAITHQQYHGTLRLCHLTTQRHGHTYAHTHIWSRRHITMGLFKIKI